MQGLPKLREMRDALSPTARFPSTLNGRYKQTRKYGRGCDDNQKFDNRKAGMTL
jgi:hypothetical protein